MESVKQEQHANQLARGGLLDRFFKLTEHRTTIKTELLAGLTTFVTMAYIIFVNPNIMATAGIDHGAAFVATFYGVFTANAIFLPMAKKLHINMEHEQHTLELVIEGLMSIQSGDNPRIVREKLEGFLAPAERRKEGNDMREAA